MSDILEYSKNLKVQRYKNSLHDKSTLFDLDISDINISIHRSYDWSDFEISFDVLIDNPKYSLELTKFKRDKEKYDKAVVKYEDDLRSWLKARHSKEQEQIEKEINNFKLKG